MGGWQDGGAVPNKRGKIPKAAVVVLEKMSSNVVKARHRQIMRSQPSKNMGDVRDERPRVFVAEVLKGGAVDKKMMRILCSAAAEATKV